MLFGNLNFGDAKRLGRGQRELPLTPAISRRGRGRERGGNRRGARRNRDVYHRPLRHRFHFVQDLPSEIAVRRASRGGGGTSDAQVFRAKAWFLRGMRGNTLPGTPGASIFQM